MEDLALALMQVVLAFPRLMWKSSDVPLGKNEKLIIGCLHRALCQRQTFLSPSRIGELTGLSRPAVTASVNRLCEEGYIERTMDPQDRRRFRITLTPRGYDLFGRMQRMLFETAGSIVTQLGEADSRELIRILHRVIDILQPSTTGGKQHCEN